jgi:NDP-sugar pyrophosphorylase family protein
MIMGTTLVVLAAGIGRRYGGLKQLEPVGPGGEALFEYSIFDALRVGFDRVVLVIRPETEAEFRRFLEPRLASGVDLRYVSQTLSDVPEGVVPPAGRTKPWGTAHAVLVAEGEVSGPFAVINADDFYGSDSFTVLGEFLETDADDRLPTFAVAGFRLGPTLSAVGPVSRGLCRVDGDGWLERIVEVLELISHDDGGRYTDGAGVEHLVAGDELASMNMWGFTPALFPELRSRFQQFLEGLGVTDEESSEFLLPEVVQGMIDRGTARVRVLRHDGQWCGITFVEDRQRVRDFIAELVARGEYPRRLWG